VGALKIVHGPRDEELIEYRELRAEIREAQGQRIQIVSITVGAFIAVLTVFLGVLFDPDTQANNLLAVSIGGNTVLLALLIPSLIMAITTQQSIVRKGNYIRRFIESRLDSGCKWETRLDRVKPDNKVRGRVFGLVGIYLFLIVLSWVLPGYALLRGLAFRPWWIVIIPAPLTIWALYLTLDLQIHFSDSWNLNWNSDEEPAEDG